MCSSDLNVVKPRDVIDLLKKNDEKFKKWSNTKQYQILSILAENSIIQGPILAVAQLYPNLIDSDAARSATKDKYDIKGFEKFIEQNAYLKTKKDPTLNEIMYECEKMLQKETREGSLEMNQLFSDAIENQVIYVKFEINKVTGLGDWDIITSDDIRKVNEIGRAHV